MSSEREPAVDATAVTLSPSNRPASVEETGASDDRTIDAVVPGSEKTGHADLAELEPGVVIARYRILGRLGAGGMGVVYRAHDAQLDRDVALKLLRVGEDGTEGRSRMLREAKAAAKIRHPNVVTVYDAGEVFGRVFIAMELIDGVTLKAHFRGRKRAWREVVEVMLGAGEGLAAAHAAGLVHRDFKPDNVLVEAGGRVRVLDFGLARPASTDAEGPTLRATAVGSLADGPPVLRTLTQTGTLVGTPAYMAPEQHLCRGVDARSDQFAYCVTFYECLFAQRPFAGDTQAELTMNVVEGRLLPPRDRGDVPAEILAALQRGMSVHPADRHESLADLLALLRASLRRHAPHEHRTSLVAAAVMLPVIAGLAVYSAYVDDPPPPTTTASEPSAPAGPREDPVLDGDPFGPPVNVPPERPGVTIGAPKLIAAGAFVELVAGVLPEGLDALTAPVGVRVVGAGAGAWREPLQVLLSAIDVDNSRRPPGALVTQFSTPDGLCALYLLGPDQYAGCTTEALAAVPGVLRVGRSEPLRAVLVLGNVEAQAGVGEVLRRAAAPKYREWCLLNTNMGEDKLCFPTREKCQEEEVHWFGRKSGRCKGVK